MGKASGQKRNNKSASCQGVIWALLCALIVSVMRRDSTTVILAGGIPFAYTDIFVMLPAAIGGLSSGLLTFSVLFIVELIFRQGEYAAVYTVSTYLLLTLVTAYLAYRGWYRGRRRLLAVTVILTALLSVCWYLTFTAVLPQIEGDNVFSGVSYIRLFLGALPEVVISVAITAFYFRFAPDSMKAALGSGWAYMEGRMDGPRRMQVLGTRITAISMLEAFLLCIVAIIGADIIAAGENGIVFSAAFVVGRWRESIRLGLIIMCASVPAAYLFNQYMMKYVVCPINEMSFLMEEYFKTDERCRSGKLPELDIHSGDEIEKLYHSLQKMAADMAGYIEKELEQERRSAHMTKGFMMALAKAVDAKDHYTNGHSERVAGYARELAARMGKTEKEQEEIYMMGLLHDIGKIGVPDAIINKPGRLNDEEFARIKEHPATGARILENVEELPGLAIGAHWHHERYDGRGYPDGLASGDIPEEARIIAVADAYDAMTSTRSYRELMPQSKVREEISKGRGTQFDPAIADLMLSMIDDDTEYRMHE